MSVSTIKTENGNVTCDTPEGTVVHININQRSAYDCLLDTFRFFQDMKKSGQKTEQSFMSGSAANIGFGVAYISVGLVSVMMAIMYCIVWLESVIFYANVHFWVGFPFLISGVLQLLAYRFPNICWTALVFISLLLNFAVSIAGIVLASFDLQMVPPWSPDQQVCYNLRNGRADYHGAEKPPSYGYSDDYDLEKCKDWMQKNKNFSLCFTVMTLLITIWGLCLTIFSVGCRVKACCQTCTQKRTEEEDDALIKSHYSNDVIIA